MAVTDAHIAALHAKLTEQAGAEHTGMAADDYAYVALVNAAFAQAVERRFGADSTIDDVSAYVASLRFAPGENCEVTDLCVAGCVIGEMLGLGPAVHIDPQVTLTAKQSLLAALLADEGVCDAAAYDDVLAEASRLADDWLASSGGPDTAETPFDDLNL